MGMSAHYRVGAQYLGVYGDGAEPAELDAVECPAPSHALDKWTGSAWEPHITTAPKPVEPRRAAYATESDHLKIEAEYDALVAGGAPDYTTWIAAVTAIKERYPIEDIDEPSPPPELN